MCSVSRHFVEVVEPRMLRASRAARKLATFLGLVLINVVVFNFQPAPDCR